MAAWRFQCLRPYQHCQLAKTAAYAEGPISLHAARIRWLGREIRCDAATYVWTSQSSPRVPLPRLWGFGLPNGFSVRFTRCAKIRAHLVLVYACYTSILDQTNHRSFETLLGLATAIQPTLNSLQNAVSIEVWLPPCGFH